MFIVLTVPFLMSQSGPQVKIGGLVQTTAVMMDQNDAVVFGIKRARIIASGKLNKHVRYKLMTEFMKVAKDMDKDGESPGIVVDAYLDFNLHELIWLRTGKFRTPIGQGHLVSAMDLDVVERSLGCALVFDRNMGVMLHRNKIGELGLGYAAGLFNAGPRGANDTGDEGEGSEYLSENYTTAVQLSLTPSKTTHLQIGFGQAQTSLEGQENVTLFEAAGHYSLFQDILFKAEYLSRDDPDHQLVDGTALDLCAVYDFTKRFQAVITHDILDIADSAEDKVNTTVGFNIFLNPENRRQSKIQLNYVFSDMDGCSGVQVLFQGSH